MSDVMLHGILRMPPNLWGNGPIDIAARHSRYIEASERIDELEQKLTEAREEIIGIRNTLSQNGEAVGNGEHNFSIIEMIENLIQSRDYFVKKSDSLELERDEAREKYTTLLTENMLAVNKLYKERDEARDNTPWHSNGETKDEWFARQREKYAVLERERDEAWKFLREATKQRDDALAELEVRVKERDEVRKQRDDYREEASKSNDYILTLCHVIGTTCGDDDPVQVVTELKKECSDLKEAMQELLNLVPRASCDMFHHSKKDSHKFAEPCPMVERYNAKIKQAKEALKNAS